MDSFICFRHLHPGQHNSSNQKHAKHKAIMDPHASICGPAASICRPHACGSIIALCLACFVIGEALLHHVVNTSLAPVTGG
jgi:hypothetical protein